jgi:hypothetical protein
VVGFAVAATDVGAGVRLTAAGEIAVVVAVQAARIQARTTSGARLIAARTMALAGAQV